MGVSATWRQAYRKAIVGSPLLTVFTFFAAVAWPAQAVGPCDFPTIEGTAGPDVLMGTGGDDVIRAFAGPDVVHGGVGSDVACGDEGADVIFLNNQDHGSDFGFGGAGNDIIYLGPGDDFADGGPNFDVCYGGLNTDTFVNCELIVDLGCPNECPFP